MKPETHWKPHQNVVFTRFDDVGAALLNLETKRYYSLNETALRIWELMAAGADLAAIAEAVQREYEIELAAAEARVERFLEELAREGLVESS